MGTEFHPVFCNSAQSFQTEDLKAAAVREDGPAPRVEFVESPAPRHQIVTGAQIQVIGIAEDNLRADGFQIIRGNGLDTACRTYGHEDRSFNRAVRSVQQPGAGVAVHGQKMEGSGDIAHQKFLYGFPLSLRGGQPHAFCLPGAD